MRKIRKEELSTINTNDKHYILITEENDRICVYKLTILVKDMKTYKIAFMPITSFYVIDNISIQKDMDKLEVIQQLNLMLESITMAINDFNPSNIKKIKDFIEFDSNQEMFKWLSENIN